MTRVALGIGATGPTGPTGPEGPQGPGGLGLDVKAKTTSYTILAGDSGFLITFNGANKTATLPSAAPAEPWAIGILNLNSTPLTISPNGLQIQGSASSITIAQNQHVFIWSDGTNYFAGGQIPGSVVTGSSLRVATQDGVVGDGTTDDTAALQAWLNNLSTTGAAGLLPKGFVCKITSALTVGANTVIYGYGATLSVQADVHGLAATSVSGIHIFGLAVNGNKASRTSGATPFRGIYFVSVTDLLLEDVETYNAQDHGIHLNGCDWFRLSRVYSHDNGKDASSVGGSGIALTLNVDGCVGEFVACRLANNTRAGYRFASVGVGSTIHAYVKVIGGSAIGNGNGFGAIGPGYDCQGDGTSGRLYGLEILGGEYKGNNPDGIRLVGGVRGMTITGAHATFNQQNGLTLDQGVQDCQVLGGSFSNNSQSAANTYDGIALLDSGTACLHNVFDGVRALDDQLSPTQRYGISEANLSDYSKISGGDYAGNVTGYTLLIGGASGNTHYVVPIKVRAAGDTGDRFRIDSAGVHGGVGGASAVTTNLTVDGAGTAKRWKTLQALAALDGLVTKTVAGAVTDGAFTEAPIDGTLAVDTTDNNLWVRSGGAWFYTGHGQAATYKSVALAGVNQWTALTQATRYLAPGAGVPNVASATTAWRSVIYFDPAWLTDGSLSNKLRLLAWIAANSTASTVTFTVGLYPISAPTGAGGALSFTAGSVVTGSTITFTTPAANANTELDSGDFAAPAAGTYAVGVTMSGAMAASSDVVIGCLVQGRQV